MSKIRMALVGLGFGGEFASISLHHPNIEYRGICDTKEHRLSNISSKFGIERCHTDIQEVIDSDEYDAVHIVTSIPLHAEHTIAVLESGKHCACTVPMATSIEDLKAIVAAQRKSGKNYMMMETAVYHREFLFAKEMYERGEMGDIVLLKGAHYQDMEKWPPYWEGLPPMWYASHAISPLLALTKTRATKVHCFGSGRLREELQKQYGNPYPAETAIFQLEGMDAALEVTRTLFHTARSYTESFSIYGEDAAFEWQQLEDEAPVLFRMAPYQPGDVRPITEERIEIPDRQDLLPKPIARFTQRGIYDESNPHLSFMQGGGHGGSHPHLVHEFVSSIVENRKPAIDAVTAANWTAAGICAHESAMKGGDLVVIPSFE